MSIFNDNENKKTAWPAFKWKTGKKIKNDSKFEDNDVDNNGNDEIVNTEIKDTNKTKSSKKKNEEIDEIIEIPSGSLLRIDGVEYQINIAIKENDIINTNHIHKKVTDPNGPINKWEYKNAELKYDKDDNIFYYVIESPKKG